MRFDIRPCLPGRAVDMRTAVLTGVLGVVFGWKYSVDIWLRFVTTIHNSIPYRLYTCKKKMPENIIHEHHMFPGSIFLCPHYPLILLISTKISTPSLLFQPYYSEHERTNETQLNYKLSEENTTVPLWMLYLHLLFVLSTSRQTISLISFQDSNRNQSKDLGEDYNNRNDDLKKKKKVKSENSKTGVTIICVKPKNSALSGNYISKILFKDFTL